MATSTQQAARSAIYACTSLELEGKTGLLLDAKYRIKVPAKNALDKDRREQLWHKTIELLRLG